MTYEGFKIIDALNEVEWAFLWKTKHLHFWSFWTIQRLQTRLCKQLRIVRDKPETTLTLIWRKSNTTVWFPFH